MEFTVFVGPRVSTKGSCAEATIEVTPEVASIHPESTKDDRYGLWVEVDEGLRLVAHGSVHEGASTIHNVPLDPNLVKVVVEKVVDAAASVPIPTEEVQTVGQALQTFITWPRHLVRSIMAKVCICMVIIHLTHK